MKLNNKGYMLVEIIVASVIALVMAYFLIEITIRLVNKNNDYYIESVLLTDKNLIIKEIMEDINNNSNNNILLTKINITNTSDIVTAELSFNNGTSKNLVINKSSNIIKYGNYEKKLSDNLSIKELSLSKDTIQKQLYLRIPAYTNYSDIDYGINLIIPYIEDIEVILPDIKKEPVCNPGTGGIPNCPDLEDNLIPVMYYNNKWVKADISNSYEAYKWYDYDNKLWANAVLVTDTNRSTYQNAIPGTTITETDILAYYVWIPRYKYKVWNINKVIGTDSYNARTKGIDIVFEEETNSTGTINCTYFYNSASSTAGEPNETCTGSNGDYYTHPAFTFGGNELKGFWINKFEISSSNPTATDGGGNVTNLTLRSLPNVNSWRNISLSNINTVIQNMQITDNIYGLNTSRINTDSHMITNYEWGAVAYLTNSKYGRCTSGSCTEVTINNCSNYITGIGGDSESSSYSTPSCRLARNKYNATLGVLASTTGNITGVYDMSGGSYEYVMGNISSASGSYTFYPSSSNFESSWYTTSTAKYLTPYAYGSTSNNQEAYNRGRLGDATGEIVLSIGIFSGVGWYSDYSGFPYSNRAWFTRGGTLSNNSNAGLFNFQGHIGNNSNDTTSRAVLIFLK